MARRIRALREAAGLTQEQLSEKAGIAPQYPSRLENSRNVPSLDTIASLAEALGITPSHLLAEPWQDADAERMGWAATMLNALSHEDAAFVESQIAVWMSHLKKRGAPG